MSSFYVTLMSNSSQTHFPSNSNACFTTRLPKALKVKGLWEVGLCELITPTLWKNVDENHCRLSFNTDGKAWSDFNLSSGYYPDNGRFLVFLNNAFSKVLEVRKNVKHRVFIYNKRDRRVRISTPINVSIHLYAGMASILGYESDTTIHGNSTPPHPVDVNHGVHTKLVYCDIVQPQYVGDAQVPLLRAVEMEPDGHIDAAIFDRPHYVPLNRDEIERITIQIMDDIGNKIPFMNGHSVVKLHFRQCK